MNEAGAQTLTVLYAAGGRILALTRQRAEPPVAGEVPLLRSGVEAQQGQHVATIDVDPAWAAHSLSELAGRFVVRLDDTGQASLQLASRDRMSS